MLSCHFNVHYTRIASALAVALLAGAHPVAARGLALRFPKVTVPARASIELCVFLRVPRSKPFDLATYEIRHRGIGGSFSLSHFLVYHYQGTQLATVPTGKPAVVASRGCLDLGPDDRDVRQLLFAGAAARGRGATPAGTAIRLSPDPAARAVGFVLDANFINATDQPRRASSLVKLKPVRPRERKRLLQPLLERTAEEALLVPPGTVGATEQSTAAWNAAHPTAQLLRDAWGPGLATRGQPAPVGDACVVRITGHFHKRGRFFGVDVIDGQGAVAPATGPENPFEPGRRHAYGSGDYTDPGERTFTPPRLLRVGEVLHYACWVDNGVTQPTRLGCEETEGVAPGAPRVAAGQPAKPCAQPGEVAVDCPPADAAYPGRAFTGRCVPANAVAGTTPEDEVCQLAGYYYDAAAGGGCDIAGEPALGE